MLGPSFYVEFFFPAFNLNLSDITSSQTHNADKHYNTSLKLISSKHPRISNDTRYFMLNYIKYVSMVMDYLCNSAAQ